VQLVAARKARRDVGGLQRQSVMQPSSAEYWHIDAITMRLASS
jgi:hypothetical protein